jgi:hypothetical protein
MENPWLELRDASPYVLECDQVGINYLNEKATPQTKINFESIPEPFIGNPETATVILLNLNPGDSPHDAKAHADTGFRAAMIHNLRHKPQEYLFYPLNPKFEWTACAKWWTQHLHQLWDMGGLDLATVAERLCAIEWFPYHSARAGLPTKPICPSQEYSFYLARKALGKKLVVGLRAKKMWAKVDPQFAKIPYLKNPQCGAVSVGNTPDGLFDAIVQALRGRMR